MTHKNPHAVALGKKGGSVTSKAKAEAARENGKKGGRPRQIDRHCPRCDAPPGLPCIIDSLAMTPRQFARTVIGQFHRARRR